MHLYAWNGNVPEMEVVESQAEEADGSSVITSYSIHYTKLYESNMTGMKFGYSLIRNSLTA